MNTVAHFDKNLDGQTNWEVILKIHAHLNVRIIVNQPLAKL